jgi:tetratricopeptide (TPR) repeat protein
LTFRAWVICLFGVVALARSVRGEEDPRDAERQFRFLLSRGDELRAQSDEFGNHTSAAVTNHWKAQFHRLEGDYQHFLNNHPQHARAMVAYGDLLYEEENEEAGVRWWEKAIAADPREPYAYNELANHYGHFGKADEALRYYEKAIELAPTESIFRFNWATTCQLFRKESHAVYGWSVDEIFQHSLEQFRSARDLSPQDYDLSTAYAETFYQMPKPDWREAYKAWQFCLNQLLTDSQRQFVCANLARVCIRLERYDEAREWVSKLSGSGQDSVRRAIERKIAESSKVSAGSTATNTVAPRTPDPTGK